MVKHQLEAQSKDAGFTLVELAVVMIIIGLLIGGVLKGQELIANAQVTSTVSQVKGIDAATTTFRDMYDAMPGDMPNPTVRLAQCPAATDCATAGNGNRRVDNAVPAGLTFNAAPTGEQIGFWAHLNAADLLSGVDPQGNDVWGDRYPEAEIGGGFHVGFNGGTGALNTATIAINGQRSGHYLALHVTPGAAVNAAGFLTPNQAFRIDSKLDDGAPLTGSVLAAGVPASPTGCATAAAAPSVYNESFDAGVCNLFIRFQN